MARTDQKTREMTVIITLRHEGQSMRTISRPLQYRHVQLQKPSSAMTKLALMRTATGKEDPELLLLERISSLELTAPQIATTKEPLLKDTNNKKRLAWAKKHEQWTLDRGKSVPWSDESKFEIFGSNCRVSVRCRVDERMISACVVPTVKHGGGGVMVCGCFAGDTVDDLFRISGTPNQHGYHSILQRYAIP